MCVSVLCVSFGVQAPDDLHYSSICSFALLLMLRVLVKKILILYQLIHIKISQYRFYVAHILSRNLWKLICNILLSLSLIPISIYMYLFNWTKRTPSIGMAVVIERFPVNHQTDPLIVPLMLLVIKCALWQDYVYETKALLIFFQLVYLIVTYVSENIFYGCLECLFLQCGNIIELCEMNYSAFHITISCSILVCLTLLQILYIYYLCTTTSIITRQPCHVHLAMQYNIHLYHILFDDVIDFLLYVSATLLLICGDVHPNPGHTNTFTDLTICHANIRSLSDDKLRCIKT